MNAPIARLFVLFVVLFGVLVAFTSRWTIFEAKRLNEMTANRRPLLEDQRIRRGLIRARDGALIARSERREAGTYRRVYPLRRLFGHPVGYSFINRGRAGLERAANDPLTGRNNEIATILDQLRGRQREGDNIVTTLDSRAQRVAMSALAACPIQPCRGSVVAIEPATGRVRVMASYPTYDPNDVPTRFATLNRQPGSPLFGRATQAGYPPGSTFKVVTAAAALDSGRFEPTSTLSGKSPIEISGVPLQNFGGEQYGTVDLTTALTKSINTVWAQVGERLGKDTMASYMDRFGFDAKPPIDLPRSERVASGEYREDRLLDVTSRFVDVGRMAIGQDKLRVTPLQMAMVVATIANGGTLMRPRLIERVVDQDGRVLGGYGPEVQAHVMKEGSARALTEMMANVVREGTGTAAALEGIEVAGKTGTAEIDVVRNITQPWFVGFAPVDRPRIAVAVTLERQTGEGGTVAAPIAKQVMESLLR